MGLGRPHMCLGPGASPGRALRVAPGRGGALFLHTQSAPTVCLQQLSVQCGPVIILYIRRSNVKMRGGLSS